MVSYSHGWRPSGLSDHGQLAGHGLLEDLQAVVVETVAPHCRVSCAVLGEQADAHRGLVSHAEIPLLDLGAIVTTGQRVVGHSYKARTAQTFDSSLIFILRELGRPHRTIVVALHRPGIRDCSLQRIRTLLVAPAQVGMQGAGLDCVVGVARVGEGELPQGLKEGLDRIGPGRIGRGEIAAQRRIRRFRCADRLSRIT